MERPRFYSERSELDPVTRTGDTTKFRAAVLLAAMSINEAQLTTALNERDQLLERLHGIDLSAIEIDRAHRKVSLENRRDRRCVLERLQTINQLVFDLNDR